MPSALRALGFAGAGILGCSLVMVSNSPLARADSKELKKEFEASAVKRLALENAFGPVHIVGSDAHTATVVAHKIRFDSGCQLAMELQGETLVVTSKEPEKAREKTCEVGFDLSLPRQMAMDVTVGAGDVGVQAMKGSLDFRLGAGNLSLADVDLGQLSGRAGTGDVAVTGSTVADADLKLGAGHASIALSKVPTKGHLELKVGMGSTVIALPPSAKVHATYKAGTGSLTNEFADVPNAGFTISGSAGTGDMTIKRL